jgi:hypothetical protein
MLAAAAGGALLGAIAWTWAPLVGPRAEAIRLRARLDTANAAASAWRGHAEGWRSLADKIARVRAEERAVALVAVADLDRACLNRISAARASAATIETLVAPEPDHVVSSPPGQRPARRLLDPERLRSSIQPAAGA